MSRMVSFVLLLIIILLMAAVFLMVMAQFLLPMFLAVLLVVVFRPLHQWFVRKCKGRNHLAAGLTTLSIVLIVLVPMLLILARAAAEGYSIASGTDQEAMKQVILKRGGNLLADGRSFFRQFGVELPPDKELIHSAATSVESWVAPAALRTTQFLGNFVLGLIVMVVSLYFFLADGPAMTSAMMRLTPLDPRYVQQLLDEFDRVSRAVVLATLLAAFAQGILAGLGYLVAGLDSVFLLTVMTMLLALVPFVGATAVWGSCCLWLYFYDGRPLAAILLFLWGALVVSFIDNIIKPVVLHGQSNLHPLLALLSVLGGIKALGPIGIFIGPMVVAFLQALLNILRTELDSMEPNSAALG